MHVALKQYDVLHLIFEQMDLRTVYRVALTTRKWKMIALHILWSKFEVPFDKFLGTVDLLDLVTWLIERTSLPIEEHLAYARFLDRAGKITILHYNLVIPDGDTQCLEELIEFTSRPLFPRLTRLITRSHETHLPICGFLAGSRLKDLQIRDVVPGGIPSAVTTLQHLYHPVASQIQVMNLTAASPFDYNGFKNLRSLRHSGLITHETLSSLSLCSNLRSLSVVPIFTSHTSLDFKVELPEVQKLTVYRGRGAAGFLQSLHLPSLTSIYGEFDEDCLSQISELGEANLLCVTFRCRINFQDFCKMEKLQHLTLRQPCDKHDVDDSCISRLAHALPRLKSLVIFVQFDNGAKKKDHITKVTLKSLVILSQLCKSLQDLRLGVDDREYTLSSPQPTERFASLKSLKLSPVYVAGQDPTVLVGWLNAICPKGLFYKMDVVMMKDVVTTEDDSVVQPPQSKWSRFIQLFYPRRLVD